MSLLQSLGDPLDGFPPRLKVILKQFHKHHSVLQEVVSVLVSFVQIIILLKEVIGAEYIEYKIFTYLEGQCVEECEQKSERQARFVRLVGPESVCSGGDAKTRT